MSVEIGSLACDALSLYYASNKHVKLSVLFLIEVGDVCYQIVKCTFGDRHSSSVNRKEAV